MMGWCPQKSFDFADARSEKHELYDDKFYQKDSHTAKGITTGEKLIIDYLDFNIVSIAIILFSIRIPVLAKYTKRPDITASIQRAITR
jgi:hypothetical protein